jgi:argininosuccinate lyase
VALRDGRLNRGLHGSFLRVNQSIDVDRKLYREDIRGSVAYARALRRIGILSEEELVQITEGLSSIESEIEAGSFNFREEDEDIHMNIERRLHELIGDAAHKLHTGRSRNEQVVLDERLYIMDAVENLEQKLDALCKAIVEKAKLHLATIIPSYTHLRQAQAVSLAHLFLAYYHALRRNRGRFKDFEKRLNVLPLGSGAVAGSSIGIDRTFLKKTLGFDSLSRNSIDAVSTRDFMVEFHYICVTIFLTLSRMAEDIIIFSSEEFGFYTLSDEFSTTSSLMPQKKNPDSLELVRGKTSRMVGDLLALITLVKGTPYTYNRDFQEDKEGLFDTVESSSDALELMAGVVTGLSISEDNINRVLERSMGMLFATDVADYLVSKGLPFRKAHAVVGTLVRYAEMNKLDLKEISLEVYKSHCPLFEQDVYDLFDYIHSVNCHDVIGGTALKRVAEEIRRIEEELKH